MKANCKKGREGGGLRTRVGRGAIDRETQKEIMKTKPLS